MTCLFCRCNTWASKHGLATIESKHQASQCPQWSCKALEHSGTSIRIAIINLHIMTLHKNKFSTFYDRQLEWFSPFRLHQLARQLLPPQSFINIVSLFIQRGQGSATMTTSASDCRPPINTSDTCGGGGGGFCRMRDWHCLFTTCRTPRE